MNEILFQVTATVLWLALLSAAAVLRLGFAISGTRRCAGHARKFWSVGWSALLSTDNQCPAAITWAGASLTVAWLAVLALSGNASVGELSPGLMLPTPGSPGLFLGLMLLGDWLSRQSRFAADGSQIPWQGWCAIAAAAAGEPWTGMLQSDVIPVTWHGICLPVAVAVWGLACVADLRPRSTDVGLSRLSDILRRWLLLTWGVVLLWGGGELPGLETDGVWLSFPVVLAKVLFLEFLLSLMAARWWTVPLPAGVWLSSVVLAVAGGIVTAALNDLLGKDRLLTLLLQTVVVVCGLLLAHRRVRSNSPSPAGDMRPAVG